jgi:signal transduction histidine kinase
MSSTPRPTREEGLFDLLKTRRQELIDRWIAATKRDNTADHIPRHALVDQVPLLLDELIAALHPEAVPLPTLGVNALEHGAQRFDLGFNVAEVIREYGTLHRCIVEIASDHDTPITLAEQRVVARWLNAGIVNAVSQYVNIRDTELHRQASEHLGFLAHEIRNPLSAARMAFELLVRTTLAGRGRAVDLLDRNLRRSADVIDNALSHASLRMGIVPHLERLPLRQFLEDLIFDNGAQAEAKTIDVQLTSPADLVIEADARLLRSAVANLIQNGLKFSGSSSKLLVRAHRDGERVLIEVEDACGGLPPGRAEDLFRPLVQRGSDKSGFGFGLAIALQSAEAHGGTLKVHDLPGHGCVFTIDLPYSGA